MTEDIHWKKFAGRFKTYGRLLDENPVVRPQMIVCIPTYAEPALTDTLNSLFHCSGVRVQVEVLILFNEDDRMRDDERKQHAQSYADCLAWIHSHTHDNIIIHPIWLNRMSVSKWGVGWARKIVMDEAARRLNQEGIIVCLDADCTVDSNYLESISNYFAKHVSCDALSIYIEHQLKKLEPEVRMSIMEYELHLRYLVHAKRWAGHPFAYQTFGSAMAVRRSAYLQQGGMNTRQAGEDFYFLQKFIEIGTLHELKETTVFPSSRSSIRVPFGTGKAMHDLQEEKSKWKTTSFETFRLIKPLFAQLSKLYNLLEGHGADISNLYLVEALGMHADLNPYFNHIRLLENCFQIKQHTTSEGAFRKRFFRYFNAFGMIRYMHYMHDHGYPEVEAGLAANELLSEMQIQHAGNLNEEECLKMLRAIDRGKGS